jgi:signal transduction histidine kinase
MTVTSLLVLAAFSIIYLTTYGGIKAENELKLRNAVSLLETQNEQPIKKVPYSLFVITTDKNGYILEVNSLFDFPEDLYIQAVNAAWNQNNNGVVTIEGQSWMYEIMPVDVINFPPSDKLQNVNDYQISFLDISETQKTLNGLLITFLVAGSLMIAAIFFISLYFANRSIKPISENWESQKRFVADASHELKTPLTRIILGGGLLKSNENETIKSQEEWLDTILLSADRMSKLVNNLLSLARTEDTGVQEEKQSFDIAALVGDVIQSMNTAAQMKNLNIRRNIEFIGDINGYKESQRQVCTILYENAVKYTDEGGEIEISLRRIKKSICLIVRNTGKGIPSKDLPNIFNRFYRADDARSDEENSFGLGLSIAKRLSEQIGGNITAQSIENGWTEFAFSFEA